MPVVAIEHAAGWIDDLAIPRPTQLLRPTTTLRMIGELFEVTKDALDQIGCSNRIFECDVVCNSIQVTQRGL